VTGVVAVSEERVSVRTYVPRDQKEAWAARADDLDMSQSEFVRTMVQAGVRDLGLDTDGGATPTPDAPDEDGGGLESRVVAELREREVAGWDALVDALAGDFEERLEDALASLDDDGIIRYSPREGGYVLRGDE